MERFKYSWKMLKEFIKPTAYNRLHTMVYRATIKIVVLFYLLIYIHMYKKSKFIELKEPVDDYNTLEVEVFYSKWGMNYFSWTNETRWIYVSMKAAEQVIDLTTGRIIWHRFTLYWRKSFKVMMLEMNRANQKKFNTVSDLIFDTFSDEEFLDMFDTHNAHSLFELKENINA